MADVTAADKKAYLTAEVDSYLLCFLSRCRAPWAHCIVGFVDRPVAAPWAHGILALLTF